MSEARCRSALVAARFERLLVTRAMVRFGGVMAALSGLLLVGLVGAWAGGAPWAAVVSGGALVLLVTLAYASFWFGLGLAVQRLRRSSQTNALLLLGAWLLLVVVVPASLDVALSVVEPAPSRLELLAATRDAKITATRDSGAALAAYYEDHPSLASKKSEGFEFWVDWITQSNLVDRAVAPVEERFDERVARRQAFVEKAEVLSPAVLAESLLVDIASGGPRRQQAFATQARAFDRSYRHSFDEIIYERRSFTVDDIAAVPRFVLDERELTRARGWHAARGLVLLALPSLLALAYLARRRRSVEWIRELGTSAT